MSQWTDAIEAACEAVENAEEANAPGGFRSLVERGEAIAAIRSLTPPPEVGEEELHVVFDGPPGPEAGRFVEVEDADGRSVNVGEWVKRDDGYWVLVLRARAERLVKP